MDKNKFDLEKPHIVNRVAIYGSVDIIGLNLHNSATISVRLFDENWGVIDTRVYEISGETYAQWGASDDFIVEYVKTKLAEEIQ